MREPRVGAEFRMRWKQEVGGREEKKGWGECDGMEGMDGVIYGLAWEG